MDQNDQLILIEMEERVERISSAIAALRPVIGEGKAERQLLDEIFRNVHSLKAAAQAQGLDQLTTLAHECESVLHSIRNGRFSFDDHILRALNDTTETFSALLTPATSNTTSSLETLRNIATQSVSRPRAEVEIILSALPSEVWQSLNEEEKHKLQASVSEGANLFLVSTDFAIVDFDRQFQELKERLSATGELISIAPTIQPDRPDKLDFRILYTRQASIDAVQADVASLNAIAVTAVGGISPTISRSSFPERDETRTRVERVLQRVVRAGRTAARSCGKDVDFQIYSNDLLLDQSLLDGITDPLIHLVRNAVDHGIEHPDERLKNGKGPRGTVTIRASTSQGQTRISVSDDGRGIDPTVVEETSIRLGLERHPGALTLDESVRMIFRPGFSTTASVSETSGRGVGLDVVETEIERLGGQIRVASKPGAGATFEIRLPVTFALLDVVTVRLEKQRYVIDAENVLPGEKIGNAVLDEFEVMRLSDLLGLTTPEADDHRSHALLMCEFNKDVDGELRGVERVSLLLDEVENREQVLIRSLGSYGARWFGVAGATELRDGSVALLLDLPQLVREQLVNE